MTQNRRIERHQLPYYLKVFNRFTDKPMGYIGNISREGLLMGDSGNNLNPLSP